MGDLSRLSVVKLMSLCILATGLAGFSNEAFAIDDSNTTRIINLGYLQLAAHDFFDMNRTIEVDNENGLLDASTVLFNPHQDLCDFEKSFNEEDGCAMYDDETIANGGEIRSVENIMIATASAEVGEKYLELIEEFKPTKAYLKTVEFYHEQIRIAYEESFGLKFPKAQSGQTTNMHNLALRAGHDFLPAEIVFNGEVTSLFAINPLGEKLSEEEKNQPSAPIDGVFEVEFTGIDFCPVPPFFCIQVDLLEADQSFGGQFGLGEDTFDEFMAELEDGEFDEEDEVSKLLIEAFGMGINFGKSHVLTNGDNRWDTRPTFGVNHENPSNLIVDNGFTFNDNSFTLTDNHHTPFDEQTIEIGVVNSFAATVYANKDLKVQEFLFGIPEVGMGHLAETRVEVWFDITGQIQDVKVVQDTEVIDKSSVTVTHQKSKCQETDIEENCDTTFMSAVFLEPLKDKVMAIKAMDFKLRDQTTYLNEGFDISGNSLNLMQTMMIPSAVKYEVLLKVTQVAKYSPDWVAEDGRMFEMNSFGSFKQINYKFERFQDTGNPYTRAHSGFGGIISYEQNRATEVFDSSKLVSELPESFAYIFPETGERITEEMIQKMLLQEQIAKEILDEMDKQDRHY